MATAEIKAVISARDEASSVVAGFGGSVRGMATAVAVGQLAVQAFTFALDKLGDATKMSVGAAFDQVRQVENASFALRAYEHDASKVNMVLKDLVTFARSDMGVLFKREELFKAASNLRAFGVASDEITDKVKILARGVSLGMTNFDELSQIIGRVIQKGRLDAQEFDMLAQRGIVLASSFRGAKVSSAELFTELQRVLPADLLQGRANTIDGLMIRLDSAFRDLGSSILGVDRDTSKFIKGGLGDTAIQALDRFRDVIASPELKSGLSSLGQGLAVVFTWLGEQIPKAIDWVKGAIQGMSPMIDGMKTGWETLVQIWQVGVVPWLTVLAGAIQDDLMPALQAMWDSIGPTFQDGLVQFAYLLGGVVVTSILAITVTLTVLAELVRGVAMAITWWNDLLPGHTSAMDADAEGQKRTTDSVLGLFNATNDVIDAMRDQKEAADILRGANLSLEGANLAVERAQIQYNKAVQQYGPTSLEARSAAYNLKTANARQEEAAQKASDANTNNTNAINKLKDASGGAVGAISNLTGVLGTQQVQLERVDFWGKQYKNTLMGISNTPDLGAMTGSIPNYLHRAGGGSVEGGTTYMVGEKGPELFTPASSGNITPNDKITSGGGGSTTVNINVGLMTGSAIERRDAAMKMFQDLQDIASQRGQTLSQMIGVSNNSTGVA